MMEAGPADRSEMFEQQVMFEIKRLTTKLDELQHQVGCISQTLDDHLATCHPHPHHDPAGRDLDPRQPKHAEMRRRRRHTSKEHKLACLRKSLQMNILLIIDNLPFTDSELGDLLISTDCLTEDECSDLTRTRLRKDQVRNLVRLIKSRSYKVMTSFLNCVNRISPDIAQRIWQTYSENVKNLDTTDVCTFCSLQHSVDIKLLADHVWSIGCISDPLYDEIASCPQPGDSHWYKMAVECNQPENAGRAMEAVCQALDSKGHYSNLVHRLRRKTKLECCCYRQEVHLDISVHARAEVCFEDGDSSTSPSSSHWDDFERSPLSDISSQDEDLVDIPYTEVLDNALNHHGDLDDILQTARQGFRGTNINFFRVRSNSFGKSSGVARPLSKRRASMFS